MLTSSKIQLHYLYKKQGSKKFISQDNDPYGPTSVKSIKIKVNDSHYQDELSLSEPAQK